MGYFEDVYIQRINRFGFTPQERIEGQKELAFNNFMTRNPFKTEFQMGTDKFYGVLDIRPHATALSKKEVLSYLLTYKSVSIPIGTQLLANGLIWLVLQKEVAISKGYCRYLLVQLDRQLLINNEGRLISTPVCFTKFGTTVADLFKTVFSAAFYESERSMVAIVPANPLITKYRRAMINEEAWEIFAVDKHSITGCYFLVLQDSLKNTVTDTSTTADADLMTAWKIASDLGDSFEVEVGDSKNLFLHSYYGEIERNEPLTVISSDSSVLTCAGGQVTGVAAGTTTIVVSLTNSPLIQQTFTVEVKTGAAEAFSIVGPSRIKVLSKVTFDVANAIAETGLTYESENGNFIVEDLGTTLQLTGTKIGLDSLIAKADGVVIFTKPLQVISLWLEV